jgi:hypothetical protein
MEFLIRHEGRLVELSESYLSDTISESEITEYAWQVIREFEALKISIKEPSDKREEAFWLLIWDIISYSDKKHRTDGITETILKEDLSYLKNGAILPETRHAKRP